jgi:uncharacterized membrane protein
MTHHEASTVVNLPVAEIETQLRRIEEWPQYVPGVESVTRTAFERYVFRVRSGDDIRDVHVAVVAHPRDHRITWRALSGPAYGGEFRLHSEGQRTRVGLSLTAEPAGFLSVVTELVAGSTAAADVGLQRMEAHLFGADTGAAAP